MSDIAEVDFGVSLEHDEVGEGWEEGFGGGGEGDEEEEEEGVEVGVRGLEGAGREVAEKARLYRAFLLRGAPLRMGKLGKLGGFSLGLDPLKRRVDRDFVLDGANLRYYSAAEDAEADGVRGEVESEGGGGGGGRVVPRGEFHLEGATVKRHSDPITGEISLLLTLPASGRTESLFAPGGPPPPPQPPKSTPTDPLPIHPTLEAWEKDIIAVSSTLAKIPTGRNNSAGPDAALKAARK